MIPFGYRQLLPMKRCPNVAINIITIFVMEVTLFPFAGFLGGYVAHRVAIKEKVEGLTRLEKKVLDYLTRHNFKVRISECARELNIHIDELENIIKALEEKGFIKIKRR